MDFTMLFINIFSYVLAWYKIIHRWLYPIPQQMIIYDDENKKLVCRGYVNLEIMRVVIDHFIVDGDYTIKINNKIIPNIKKRDQDGFRSDKQYFLIDNNRIYTKDTEINIIDNINGCSKTWFLKSYMPIDFKMMIEELEEDNM